MITAIRQLRLSNFTLSGDTASQRLSFGNSGLAFYSELTGVSGVLANQITASQPSGVVYITGNQTISGYKTFASSGNFQNTLYVGSGTADESVTGSMLYVKANSGQNVVDFDTANGEGLAIDSNGNVAIGNIDSPQYTLDVLGSGRFSQNLYVDGPSGIVTNNGAIFLTGNSVGGSLKIDNSDPILSGPYPTISNPKGPTYPISITAPIYLSTGGVGNLNYSVIDNLGNADFKVSLKVNGQNVATSGNLVTTGSNLQSQISSLSGTLTNNYATITNLASTGSNLQGQITSLSGTLTGNYATSGFGASTYATITNLASTGSNLQGQISSLSGTLTGNYATITNLASTGSNLQGQITSLSGTLTGNYATITNLASTGSNLQGQITSLSGTYLPANYDTLNTITTITANKFFNSTVTIRDLIVTGTQTTVNTQVTNVGSNYLNLNATGGARDAGIFINMYSGGAGGTSGAYIGFDIPSNTFRIGTGISGIADLSALDIIATQAYVTGGYATISNLASTGSNLQGQITSLSGTLTGSYATIAYVTGVSGALIRAITAASSGVSLLNNLSGAITLVGSNGIDINTNGQNINISGNSTLATSANLASTGSNLQGQITSLSGTLTGNYATSGFGASTYATITNLASTGSNLQGQITSLSGTLTGNYATITNLASTGSNLQGQISSLSGTLTGNYVLISTSTGISGALASSIASTGSNLQGQITSLSGTLTGNYATITNLASTGSNLQGQITSLSGTLTGNYVSNSSLTTTLSGYVTTGFAATTYATLVALNQKINWISGQSQTFTVSLTTGLDTTGILFPSGFSAGYIPKIEASLELPTTSTTMYGFAVQSRTISGFTALFSDVIQETGLVLNVYASSLNP